MFTQLIGSLRTKAHLFVWRMSKESCRDNFWPCSPCQLHKPGQPLCEVGLLTGLGSYKRRWTQPLDWNVRKLWGEGRASIVHHHELTSWISQFNFCSTVLALLHCRKADITTPCWCKVCHKIITLFNLFLKGSFISIKSSIKGCFLISPFRRP